MVVCVFEFVWLFARGELLPGSGRAVKVILGPHFKLFGNVSCAYTDRYVQLRLPYLWLLLHLAPAVGGCLSVLGGFNILGALKLHNTMLGERSLPLSLSLSVFYFIFIYIWLSMCVCVC